MSDTNSLISMQGIKARKPFSITDGAVIGGEIPQPKARLVQAWIEIHKEALLADWELAVNGEPPFPIDPLR